MAALSSTISSTTSTTAFALLQSALSKLCSGKRKALTKAERKVAAKAHPAYFAWIYLRGDDGFVDADGLSPRVVRRRARDAARTDSERLHHGAKVARQVDDLLQGHSAVAHMRCRSESAHD